MRNFSFYLWLVIAATVVALLLILVIGIARDDDGAAADDRVSTLTDTGLMTEAEAAELIESFEVLGLTEAEIDQTIDEYVSLNDDIDDELYDSFDEDGYDAEGFDADGCNEGETFDPSTGWCES
jgi:hypothetical protein